MAGKKILCVGFLIKEQSGQTRAKSVAQLGKP